MSFDKQVADSEYQHSARNAAIAYLMKSFGNFQGDVDTVLRTYFHYCALKMNCADLSKAMLYLANRGKSITGTELISQVQTRQQCPVGDLGPMYD